jgi:hypothetical protein
MALERTLLKQKQPKNRNNSRKDANSMKSRADFKGTMPYVSDLFGVYQPLLRWKSRIIGDRFNQFRNAFFRILAEQARPSQRASLAVKLHGAARGLATDNGLQSPSVGSLEPVTIVSDVQPRLPSTIDCGIARLLQRDIGRNAPPDWKHLITTESMATLLERLKTIVAKPTELQNFPDIADYVQSFTEANGSSDQTLLMQSLIDKETRISSYLTFLARHKPTQLDDLFFTVPQMDDPSAA